MSTVRWSTLKSILRSPAHYRHAVESARPDTDAMRVGRAVHCAVLEPDAFAGRWAIWTGGRRAGREWDAWLAELAGREQLSATEHARVESIARAVRSNAAADALLTGGAAEVELLWERDGIGCGGRVDYLAPGRVIDLKTTRDASPRAFGRQAASMLYHAQLAWYAYGARQPDAELYLIAVESEPPHACVVYRLDEDAVAAGRAEYELALELLRECRAADQWPGYATGVARLELPRWAYGDDESSADALGLEGL